MKSCLSFKDKEFFERIFTMSDGYPCDFVNRTFQGFFASELDINIYDDYYQDYGTSKANRLRCFWDKAPHTLVVKALSSLLEREKEADRINETDYQMALSILNSKQVNTDLTISSEEAFLAKSFSELSLSRLNINQELVSILDQRINEIQICLQNSAFLSVIFLAGSTLECLLLNLAKQNLQLFNEATAAPKSKDGQVKPLQDWGLSNFIDTACELRFIGKDVKEFSHSVRKFRNYIHPNVQAKENFLPDHHTAKITWVVLQAVIDGLSKKNEPTHKAPF
jgi:hypothetical protein